MNKVTIRADMDFIYARKSTEDKKRQVASIPDQLEISHRLAIQHHAVIPQENIYTDTKTGMKPRVRENFNCMVERIINLTTKGSKCRLFGWKPCRLARNSSDGGILTDLVRDGKLTVITEIGGVYDEARFHEFHGDMGYNSKFSKDLSTAVKRNNSYKLSLGIYPGKSPLGYKFNPDKLQGLKDHVLDPKNHNQCREWVDLMLSGQYTIEKSLEIMTAKGLVGRHGEPVSKTLAYKFFRNIFYTGLFVYKGTTYKGCHKPLMTMTEYNKIQRIIDGRGHKQDLGNPLWFQGIESFKCGYCGGSITGEKHRKVYKNGIEQWFYHARCTKKLGPCPERFLNAETMKDQINSYLDEMEIAEDYINLIRKVLKRRNQQEFQNAAKDRELQTKRLESIDKQKETLYGMKAEGFYDANLEEYEKKKADLLKQEMLVKQEIMPDSTAYWSELLENTCDFILRMKDLFRDGDIYTKQMVLKILGSNLTLKDKKIKIEAKNAFIAIKRVQKEISDKMGWVEPANGLSQSSKDDILYPSLPYSSA